MASKVDVRFTPSSFGGGWIEAETPAGRNGCEGVMGTGPDYFSAIENDGWMLEPYEVASTVEMLRDRGLAVEL